jgi:OOP family OmpA-OmpF porin
MKHFLLFLLFASVSLVTKAQSYKIENGGLVLDSPILFDAGTDKLKPESDVSLNLIKQYLTDKSYITLMRIEGHVSGMDEAANASLAKKRAMAVCKWLIAHGIDCKRLIAVGFGSTKPVADNNTLEGKAKNTRIEAKNAALKGRAIGGMPVDGGGEVAGDACL